MKQVTILVLSALISTGAFAKAPAKAEAKKADARETAQSLKKEIEKLNYSKDDDRFKGGEKSRKAVEQLQAFDQMPKKDDKLPLFNDLLSLSREAAPYDDEGQIASVLSDMLKRDKTLKNAYGDYLKSLPKAKKGADYCKNEQLEKSVAEAICEIDNGGAGQDSANAKTIEEASKCVSKFNYEECLKK